MTPTEAVMERSWKLGEIWFTAREERSRQHRVVPARGEGEGVRVGVAHLPLRVYLGEGGGAILTSTCLV
eukprot:CAMPEP_0183355602 /NCGR_PEP_ID=MMETSP0164_2-20130417/41033_1 /TAXON_ID=221442 /ORGANISM="Coccolithus pelagicus ssp braarudi, Strain PLY182g" /LENGTH=68 /DNA_ID=CAMNT_0025528751 /DNA_START=70 /DNA_END=276 /DNA_ORIENTATION=-